MIYALLLLLSLLVASPARADEHWMPPGVWGDAERHMEWREEHRRREEEHRRHEWWCREHPHECRW
jgi:hypothetical protein